MIIKRLFPIVPLLAGILSCSRPSNQESSRKVEERPERIIVCGPSFGHSVLIKMDDEILWNGEIKSGRIDPDLHVISLPKVLPTEFKLIIEGGPYQSTTQFDWRKGPRIVINFKPNGKIWVGQDDGEAKF